MPIPLWVTAVNKRVLNPLTLRLAGHGSMVALEHVGRTSGRTFRTPLMAFVRNGSPHDVPSRHGRPTAVVVALTYGPDVQWLKNLTAAGGGRLLVQGRWLTVGPPRRLDPADGLAAVAAPQRFLLRTVIHCNDVVELPVLAENGPD